MMTRTNSRADRQYHHSDYDDAYDLDDEDRYYGNLRHEAHSRGNYRRQKTSFINSIPLDWMIGAGSVAVIVESTVANGNSYSTFLLGAAWLGFCAVVIGYADAGVTAAESGYKKFFKKYGSTGIWGIVFGVVALTALFFAVAEPSQAQFLVATETTVKKLFTSSNSATVNTSATAVTSLNASLGTIFTGLRGVLIMALLYAAYKMFMARDDQEDLKMQARMPILLLVITTITDVTAGAIAGPAGA